MNDTTLKEFQKELETQDNRATAHPLYVVYQTEHVPTDSDYSDKYEYYDPHSSDDFDNLEWFVESNEIDLPKPMDDDELFKWLEEHYDINKVYYLEKPKFVTAFFTNKAAELYIRANAHNLKDPYVYVESLYRNYEMQAVRNHFVDGDGSPK